MLTIIAAAVPDTMSVVTTANENQDVKITWSAPASNGGSAITGYRIKIVQSDGSTYTEDATNCDGTNAVIKANSYCHIPMTTLTAAPYSLAQNAVVKATAEAINVVGYSTASTANTVGAAVQTIPQAPATAPARNDAGTTSSTI